jgi:GDP/UDP-N,N'-diacetylbacillosamine 2-epimerase (hydrolysing)
MSKRRKIIFITGARSEYDIMYPVLEKLRGVFDIDLKLIVTGAHLSEMYGKTVQNIENDGFEISDKIYNLINSNEKIGRVISLGNQISGLALAISREKPDIVVVVGDREEAISVTLTCAYLSIFVAHIGGGDIANDGNIDNSVRYAATKLAHIHFTLLEQHAQVLRLLGEEDFRIFNVGNPALDKFIDCEKLSRDKVIPLKEFGISNEDYLILIQHPIITDANSSSKQIEQTLEAIRKSGYKCFVNYPNSDAGNFQIIEKIVDYSNFYPDQFFLFKNLDRVSYINLLRHASCLIGNSSSGIIEAPSIGLPVVNVGTRQRDRVSAGNVIYVDYQTSSILDAIEKSVTNKEYRKMISGIKNPYGDGNSAEKIATILRTINLDNKLLYKNITYNSKNS